MQRRDALTRLATATLLATASTRTAFAQGGWPNGPIRFLVPYPPGGPTDLMARMLAPELQQRLGVNIVVDNKSGAAGNIGTAEVARQLPADGQTLLLAASGPMAVNGALFRNLPFNALTDLVPVAQLSAFPLVLDVHPSLGVTTLKDFIAKAKAAPEPMTFASAGNGTPQHLAGEMFARAAGLKMVHVPYKGAGPALNDVIGGQVKVMFDVLGSSLPHIQAGRLVPIAVTAARRSPALPKTPTMAEAGLAGFETTAWHGIAVRAGTPAAVVDRLNGTLLAIFRDPAFRKRWEAIGTPVVAASAAEFGSLVRSETVRLGRVVREAGVTAD